MPITPDIPAAETAIVKLTNKFRAEHQLGAVKPNAELSAAARAYAKVLGTKGSAFSHTADGSTPASRAKTAGYAYCEIAENLAAFYDSRGFTGSEYARRAIEGWIGSPGHRHNLLMPNVTDIGVAVVRASSKLPNNYIAVQLFARPLKLKYTFKIANRAPAAVGYMFAGKELTASPRQIITHTSRAPGTITFSFGDGPAHYEAHNGQVYTLSSGRDGGITVEVEGGAVSP